MVMRNALALTALSLVTAGLAGCGEGAGVPGVGKTMVYGEVCGLTGEPLDLCPML